MSLRKKILALFLILGISLLLGSSVVLKTSVFPIFEEFERQSSEEALKRVTRMLEEDLRALQIMNMEYSLWDATYEFAIGERPDYVDETLDPEYWHSIDINLLAIFDAHGKELFSWMSDSSGMTELSLKDELPFTLEPGNPLISFKNIGASLRGVVNMRSGIMQLVSYPILTSEGDGPIAGTFIVGQTLTSKRVRDLGDRATTNLSLLPIDGASEPATAATLTQRSAALGEFAHIETDDSSVRGYKMLTDISNAPIAMLEVSAPRKITEIGARTIRTTLTALAVAAAIFLAGALLFLQKLITTPVTRLTSQITHMRESGDLDVDIRSDRADEIGTLALEFGELTRNLSSARAELEAARDDAMGMSKAKSEFLARMSHEIRTPMNGVLGMTELLQETALDDKQQRFANTIYESAESLLSIINDILDISKIEAGKIELDIAAFNLQNLLEECLDLLAESAHRKGLELACVIPIETNVYVKGDPVRLRQILMNLLGNALKFTEQGEVVVRFKASPDDAGKTNFRFEVQDTGIGISPENLVNIFEPFVQEDGSNTRRFGGTGLGLAISKQLVDLMGGEMGVHSEMGKGSTFWFTVRLAEDQVTAPHPQPHLLAGKTAFVVDDNQTNREILRHQLEGWGMRVETASGGAEALEFLRNEAGKSAQPDVMLLDMAMPGMDGLQLAQAIRNEHEYRHTPIAMLSSISREHINHEQSTAGPDDWLAKPIRRARLFDTLLSLLGRTEIDANDAEEQSAVESITPREACNGLRVLLVDDNEVNLAVAEAMLESLGHQARVARNGLEAVVAYEEQMFDVVLMDCRMPEMDGFQATQEIRDLEKQLGRNQIPIIALTAHALQGDRERCLAAGMSDYLSKPFTKQQLDSILSANTGIDSSTTGEYGDVEAGPSRITSAAVAEFRPKAKIRILIVEDNDVNQQVTQAMLESLGYESEIANDGDEALQAMACNEFDLILLDCHMPVRNGYDTAKEIRAREEQSSELKRIPIVALTADFLESNRQKCLDHGMDDYVTKPVTQEEMRLVLNRWLTDEEAEDRESLAVDSDGFSELRDSVALGSIDPDALNEIRQLDPSSGAIILREIVVSYCASSSKLMLRLRSAVADHDVRRVEQLAHSLKGGSSQLGATLLATLCDDMIASARHNEPEQLIAQFERAAIEHCAVLSGLDRALQNIAA